MRSMAVRPRIFSRFRCWAGREVVVEHHGVGVDGQAHRRQLLGLALAQIGGRVGVVRRWTTRSITSAPAVSTSRASSSRPASVPPAVAVGQGDPDQHDPLPDGPRDEGVGERRVGRASRPGRRQDLGRRSTSMSATLRTGPLQPRPRRHPATTCEGAPRIVHGHRRRPPGPSSGRRRRRRTLPVPQASGLPHPALPHPQGDGRPARARPR